MYFQKSLKIWNLGTCKLREIELHSFTKEGLSLKASFFIMTASKNQPKISKYVLLSEFLHANNVRKRDF